MRNQVISSIICLFLLSNCNQTVRKEVKKKNTIQESFSNISDTISDNHNWMQAINDKNIELLSSLYTENALVLSEKGVDLNNRKEILELVPNSNFIVKSVSTKKRIKANDNYDYEIGSFINKDGGLAKHLIIWKTNDGNDKRELEFITVASGTQIDLEAITLQREQWMILCNVHDAKSLIDNVYSENTMYYNRGRLLKGRNHLVEEYDYMNNPEYKLKLEPILVEPVSESIVYEMGQCIGSYNGKYIIIWQKNDNGIWQVLFDSNI
jgi:ketosteroid isomerase-like protein